VRESQSQKPSDVLHTVWQYLGSRRGDRNSVENYNVYRSVADPDPGSGAFLPPGSGIRIRDGAMVGSGSGISKQNL
jgi:hypothetical protein